MILVRTKHPYLRVGHHMFNLHTINLQTKISTISPRVIYCIMPMKIAQRWWKENLGTELGTNIFMKFIKGEDVLIEYDVSRDVDTPSGYIKALIAFVRGAITKEATPFRMEFKLLGIVGSKVRPTRTTKHLEPVVIWFSAKEPFKR
jgi:hypothetical protein